MRHWKRKFLLETLILGLHLKFSGVYLKVTEPTWAFASERYTVGQSWYACGMMWGEVFRSMSATTNKPQIATEAIDTRLCSQGADNEMLWQPEYSPPPRRGLSLPLTHLCNCESLGCLGLGIEKYCRSLNQLRQMLDRLRSEESNIVTWGKGTLVDVVQLCLAVHALQEGDLISETGPSWSAATVCRSFFSFSPANFCASTHAYSTEAGSWPWGFVNGSAEFLKQFPGCWGQVIVIHFLWLKFDYQSGLEWTGIWISPPFSQFDHEPFSSFNNSISWLHWKPLQIPSRVMDSSSLVSGLLFFCEPRIF